MTQHFKSHYMPVTVMETLRLYQSSGKYALVNTVTNEYAIVPLFVANEWRCSHYIVTRGPFVFHDGFNETDEAAYLLRMLQYSVLIPKAQAKVDDIYLYMITGKTIALSIRIFDLCHTMWEDSIKVRQIQHK